MEGSREAAPVALSGLSDRPGPSKAAYTWPDFQPDALIFGASDAIAAQYDTVAAHFHAGIGFATGLSSQSFVGMVSRDAQGNFGFGVEAEHDQLHQPDIERELV